MFADIAGHVSRRSLTTELIGRRVARLAKLHRNVLDGARNLSTASQRLLGQDLTGLLRKPVIACQHARHVNALPLRRLCCL
jgi:hypothetical protein